MALDTSNRQARGYRSFRNSLDIGMGFFYVVIALLILNMKYFGTMQLEGWYPYILGGLMMLYGIFRIYRGFKAIRPVKKRD